MDQRTRSSPQSHMVMGDEVWKKRPNSGLEALNKSLPSGIPPDPLPVWANLPLDAKLPMLPAPKGAVKLYTTDICDKVS